MNPEHVIMIVIDSCGGSVSGKTLLQKRIYFLCEIMELDLSYRPHYYGPYSPVVDQGLTRLKALGFLMEHTTGFGRSAQLGMEIRRYDYALTDDGKTVVQTIRRNEPDICRRIRDYISQMERAGDTGNYIDLSIAAKTHFILKKNMKSMNSHAICEAARQLGWNVSEDDIRNASALLRNMKMIDQATS
jgi:uncharacterized protein YwgA